MLELQLQLEDASDVAEMAVVVREALTEVVDCGKVSVLEVFEVTIVVDGMDPVAAEVGDAVEDGDAVVVVESALDEETVEVGASSLSVIVFVTTSVVDQMLTTETVAVVATVRVAGSAVTITVSVTGGAGSAETITVSVTGGEVSSTVFVVGD